MTDTPPTYAAPRALRLQLLLALVLVALGWTWLALPSAPAVIDGAVVEPAFAAYPEPPPEFDSMDPASLRRLAEQPSHPELMPPAPLPALVRQPLVEARAALSAPTVRLGVRPRGGEARAPPALSPLSPA